MSLRDGQCESCGARYPTVFSTVDLAIVTENSAPEVLLGRKADRDEWQFPGGFFDVKDINLRAAAIREAYEETNLVIKPALIDDVDIDDPRYRNTPHKIHTHFFFALVTTEAMKFRKAGDDLAEVALFRVDQFPTRWLWRPHRVLHEALDQFLHG